jgi:YD repeat-containing protein
MPTSGTALLTSKSILSYDAMGRVLTQQTCVYPTCTTTTAQYPMSYTYDLAGDLTSYENGNNSILFTNNYDGAGRLASVSSSWNDATHPGCLFSAQAVSSLGCSQTETTPYAPFGGLTNAIYGTGLTINRSYDNRLRPMGETDTGQP